MPGPVVWFIIWLVITLALSIAQYLLRPKPGDPALDPGSLDNIPIAEQGTPIPVVFGKRWLRKPNVVWWGAVRVEPIRREIGSGGSS